MEKYSSCCGVPMNGQYQDYQRCPSCKESCDAVCDEVEPIEYITVKITKDNFDALIGIEAFSEYEVKEVSIKDNLFDNDQTHSLLKKASLKAYKQLKEYEFNKRHNIRK